MMNTSEKKNTSKILIDLKPALDGYAGIPQETRIIFYCLQHLEGYSVEGLILHGGHSLKPGISDKKKKKSTPEQIKMLSRVVISILEHDRVSSIKAYFRRYSLRLGALLHIPAQLTCFDSTLFNDFIWRTFFSKTLNSDAKDVITSSKYRVITPSKNQLHHIGLGFKMLTSSPPYLIINTHGISFFLAQTPFPGRVLKETKMIIRYHDAVPLLMPHMIGDRKFHHASHYYALQDNIKHGAWFACISEATKRDLIKIFPSAEKKSVVIYNIVSEEYYQDSSEKAIISKIIPNRLGSVIYLDRIIKHDINIFKTKNAKKFKFKFNYLLIVSTIEPRKNHILLLDAWMRLKYSHMPDLKLVMVGHFGWDYDRIVTTMMPWVLNGEIFYLNDVPAYELRILYQHATATVCPSFHEGFDYSGIEAMCCGCPVISSDIPVHREIYDNASAYFNPYSVDDAVHVMSQLLIENKEENITLQTLIKNGNKVHQRYSKEAILPKWGAFLNKLSSEN